MMIMPKLNPRKKSRVVVTIDPTPVNRELPGFEFDESSGRYYRIPKPGTNARFLATKSLENRKLPNQPKAEFKHLPDLLMNRQLGCKRSVFTEKKLLQMKTLEIRLSETMDFNAKHSPNFKEVVFLKAGAKSLLVEFRVFKGVIQLIKGTNVSEMTHPFTPEPMRDYKFQNYTVDESTSVNDMCMGFKNNDCILYVGNSLRNKMGVTQLMWRAQAVRDPDHVFRHLTCIYPIWCCCSNNFTEKFALGLQGGFSINNITGNLYSREVKGNVRGITFNERGTVVYSALHNGKLWITDLRSQRRVACRNIDNIGLDEAVLTADENYMICGGFDGLLCKVDLRTYHKVLEYIGHVHSPWKVPFSISEPHNLLTATGTDNVTRLWSLTDGGEPLNYVHPLVEGPLCRSCLIGDGSRISLFVTQNHSASIYNIFT